MAARPLADPVDRLVNAESRDIGGGHGAEAERLVAGQVRGRVQRAADAHVRAGVQREEPLLDGPAERGAVRVRRAEVGVPGVQVRVEVDQRDRAVPGGGGPQQRQRDGVVAADGDQVGGLVEQRAGGVVDAGDGFRDIEGAGRDVAGVGHLVDVQRAGFQPRVVGPEQLRPVPHGGGAEPRPRAVRDAGVERDAGDRDGRAPDVLQARQPGERVGTREPGHPAAVRRAGHVAVSVKVRCHGPLLRWLRCVIPGVPSLGWGHAIRYIRVCPLASCARPLDVSLRAIFTRNNTLRR